MDLTIFLQEYLDFGGISKEIPGRSSDRSYEICGGIASGIPGEIGSCWRISGEILGKFSEVSQVQIFEGTFETLSEKLWNSF